uniref:Phylloseptin-N1 n=1 Tax=Pithecopus nordestinus TaxID=2034992 RepID=PLS1_PITNO|nr:RecName: Full=Phylloseptin-N1; Short=PLS-N1; AltName: Full=Phylloseptin-H6; Short=PLS-H6 [Pithecopus nordestinus]
FLSLIPTAINAVSAIAKHF